MNQALLINIVIPVFNNWELTRDCLESLRNCTSGEFFEVTVVDNGSTDATPVECPSLGHSLFGDLFRYERFGENRNFGPACNQGVITSTAPFIFFLNNDTILTPDWHEPLLEAFGTMPGLGGAGPLLLYPDHDRVQHLGICVDPAFELDHLYEYFPVSHPAVARRRSLQAITGAALMIPRNLFLDCGGFHDGYENGFEDVDLCLAVREAGRTLSVIPESVVYHIANQSEGRFDAEERNAELLMERWGHRIRPDLHLHVREDGFVLRLSPLFESMLSLPDHRERELNREFEGVNDPVKLFEAIQREPLWFSGYDRLAALLESGELWPEAYEVRMLQCALGPSQGRLERLRRAAVHSGNVRQAELVSARIVRSRLAMHNAASKQRIGGSIADRLHRAGEKGLERVFRTAMRRAMEQDGTGTVGELGRIDPLAPDAA